MKKSEIPITFRLEEPEINHGINIMLHTFDDYELHRHDFYEFEYVLEGEGQCEINSKNFRFGKGDLSFVTPLDLHAYKSETSFKTITVHFNLDKLSDELTVLSDAEACTIKCSDEIKNAFSDLLKEEESCEIHHELARANLLERVVILFLRMHKRSRKSEMPKEVIYAVGYINQNFRENITLGSMSRMIGYSPEYFCRQFKKFTGMSFVEYLTDIRVRHARNLLMQKKVTVTQLCYECGFGSVRSLNRAFQKKFSCSPKNYKSQNMS